MTKNIFAKKLIDWYQQHGRHDLPWQKNKTPYRVWVSEIMLQQTQVNTVIPYYLRFMKRFPTLTALATAPEDDVLSTWSGLGYYARARNLHRAAKIIHNEHHGRFPNTVDTLAELPGIGKSTAGAILSFSKQQFAVILDGNVKRVLSRLYVINEPLNQTKPLSTLWSLATELTPQQDAHHYNQAIMDLGATICTRSNPKCPHCPLKNDCLAFQNNTQNQFPVKIIKKNRPVKKTIFMIIQNIDGDILLQKRESKGIWGGLWSFPECENEKKCTSWNNHRLKKLETLSTMTHQFTHFTLEITPIRLCTNYVTQLDSSHTLWYNVNHALPGGIAAPVSTLLKIIRDNNLT